MDIRSLRYFLTVAREANITHAAEKLNMSQPPLTHQMQLLEAELGTALFIRGKRRLTLTDAGVLLARRAEEILKLEEKTRSEILSLKDDLHGTLDIGMVEGRAPFMASRWIAGFREEFPGVKFSLWNGSSDDAIDRLNKGLCDFAVVALPYNGEQLEGIVVAREPWVAIIPKDHPLAALPGNTCPLASLADQPLIVPSRRSRRDAIRRMFDAIHASPDFICDTSNYLNAVALSEQGVGIAIFPQTTYTPNNLVSVKVITHPRRHIEYALVYPKNRPLTPLAEEFLNYVTDFIEGGLMETKRFEIANPVMVEDDPEDVSRAM